MAQTAVFSPQLLNDLRVNVSRNTGHQIRIPDEYGGERVPNPSLLFPDFVSPEDSVLSIYLRGAGGAPALLLGAQGTNTQRQWNLVDTISWNVGAHQWKLGVDHRRLTPVFDFIQYQQTINFASVAEALNGNVASAIIQAFRGPFFPRFTNLSLFAQDTWSVSPRLTLTYGVRYEVNPAPSEKNGNDPRTVTAVDDPTKITLAPEGTRPYKTTWNNFAPRFGAAYKLWNRANREMLVRGGVGIFYDIASTQTSAAYRAFSYPYAATRNLAAVTYPFSASNASMPEFTTAPPYNFVYGADPDLKLPCTIHFNIGVEQSLGNAQMFSVMYVGSAGRRLYRTEFYQNQVPNFVQLRVVRNLDSSNYNALQLQYRRRLSRGLQVLAHYTVSKSIDTSSSETQMYLPVILSSPAQNRGPSDFAGATHSLSRPASRRLRASGSMACTGRSQPRPSMSRRPAACSVSRCALTLCRAFQWSSTIRQLGWKALQSRGLHPANRYARSVWTQRPSRISAAPGRPVRATRVSIRERAVPDTRGSLQSAEPREFRQSDRHAHQQYVWAGFADAQPGSGRSQRVVSNREPTISPTGSAGSVLMIVTIAQKELLSLWRDGRSRWTGATLLVLLSISTIVGFQTWSRGAKARDEAAHLQRDQWLNRSVSNSHIAAHAGTTLFRPLDPLSAFDTGIDRFSGASVFLEPHRRTLFAHASVETAARLGRFPELTAAVLLQSIVPLLIVLLTYSALSGEREQGTLRHLLSLGVHPVKLAIGKMAGLGAPVLWIVMPSLLTAVMTAADRDRAAVLALAYIIYLAIFTTAGVVISAVSRNSQHALVILLGFWLATCFLVPRLAVAVAQRVHPAPAAQAFH